MGRKGIVGSLVSLFVLTVLFIIMMRLGNGDMVAGFNAFLDMWIRFANIIADWVMGQQQ